jgi:hypothetical protein
MGAPQRLPHAHRAEARRGKLNGLRVRLYSLVPLAAAAWLATACSAASQKAACPASAVDTTGWRRVEAGSFSILLPRAYRPVRAQGIDTDVRIWRADRGREISSDYGSVFLVGAGDDRIPTCTGDGGVPARLSHDQAGGRHQVDQFAMDPSRPTNALWLHLSATRAAGVPELLAIARSVRWRRPLVGRLAFGPPVGMAQVCTVHDGELKWRIGTVYASGDTLLDERLLSHDGPGYAAAQPWVRAGESIIIRDRRYVAAEPPQRLRETALDHYDDYRGIPVFVARGSPSVVPAVYLLLAPDCTFQRMILEQ